MAPLSRASTRSGSAGFTLLEVLLAIGLLGVLTALIATAWSQAQGWAMENAGAQRALRLPRVTELIRTQWADRRATVGVGRASESIEVAPGGFSFVTATPVLFPDWPLVHAAWRVARDDEASTPDAERFRLIYEETPVTEFERPEAKDDGADGGAQVGSRRLALAAQSRASIPPRTLIVLRACERLSVERWGPEYRATGGLADRRSREEPPDPNSEADHEPRAFGPDAWRIIDSSFDGVPPALRLSGVYERKAFECTLIVGDSR